MVHQYCGNSIVYKEFIYILNQNIIYYSSCHHFLRIFPQIIAAKKIVF